VHQTFGTNLRSHLDLVVVKVAIVDVCERGGHAVEFGVHRVLHILAEVLLGVDLVEAWEACHCIAEELYSRSNFCVLRTGYFKRDRCYA
jgi:hypothetical protein